jgi:type IV pilus assembly protein PilV
MRKINLKIPDGGFSLVEVLITLLIVTVGLLGVSQLLARSHISEMESYQRVQGLILLSDTVDRIKVNRETASCFAVTTDTANGIPFIGTAGTGYLGTPTCTASTGANNAQAITTLNEIDGLLAGAAEVKSGTAAGAMIGARSCISYDSTTELADTLGVAMSGTGVYTVVVVWQGLSDTTTSLVNCANNLYGNENRRRVVSTTLRIAKLD